MRGLKIEDAREFGTMMYGTPDHIVTQIERQHERIGGFDHLLMMMQAGFLWFVAGRRRVRSVQMTARQSITPPCRIS